MRRRSLFISILLIVFLIGAMLYGGGAYLLHVSVDPGASVYRHPHSVQDTMTRLYHHLHPWLDSLESHHALRDTTITAPDGAPLHALYVRSSRPSNRIALLVHGYQDAALATCMQTFSCLTYVITAEHPGISSEWDGAIASTLSNGRISHLPFFGSLPTAHASLCTASPWGLLPP